MPVTPTRRDRMTMPVIDPGQDGDAAAPEGSLDVDPTSLREAASDLGGAAETLTTTAGEVKDLGTVGNLDVHDGLEALSVAWGAALEVLGDDVQYLSERTGSAAEFYDTTDLSLADHMRRH